MAYLSESPGLYCGGYVWVYLCEYINLYEVSNHDGPVPASHTHLQSTHFHRSNLVGNVSRPTLPAGTQTIRSLPLLWFAADQRPQMASLRPKLRSCICFGRVLQRTFLLSVLCFGHLVFVCLWTFHICYLKTNIISDQCISTHEEFSVVVYKIKQTSQ